MNNLQPHHVQKIHELIEAGQILHAIQTYREATGVGLKEAKQAVEAMVQNEYTKPPPDVRSYDNPVLEDKIRSLLAKDRKIDAVKIYREEYGAGLGEAKSAVDRIESSMPRPAVGTARQESAFGPDPFAEGGSGESRSIVLLFVIVGVLVVCGLALLVFVLTV